MAIQYTIYIHMFIYLFSGLIYWEAVVVVTAAATATTTTTIMGTETRMKLLVGGNTALHPQK